MGKSATPGQFVNKIERLGTMTERNALATINKGAFAFKNIVLTQAESQGVRRSSKLARKSWGVNYKVTPGSIPFAVVKIRGPFHLVNSDTKEHEVRPKTKGRGAKKKALAFNGIVVASAMHPGTKGKGIWANATNKGKVVVPKLMAGDLVNGWRKVMR